MTVVVTLLLALVVAALVIFVLELTVGRYFDTAGQWLARKYRESRR